MKSQTLKKGKTTAEKEDNRKEVMNNGSKEIYGKQKCFKFPGLV